jgi:phosphoserine aminotransferase
MTTFYPGPAKIYPQVADYLQDAYRSGILSSNHRSESFMQICQKTLDLLHKKLNIPADYAIVFVSSATECWEIITQSFTEKNSLHLYNGAFGEKWFDYAQHIKPTTQAHFFDLETRLEIPESIYQPECLCLTQNETSNGTRLNTEQLTFLRTDFPNTLIAYDVTSALGGVDLPMKAGDIWFASVQKCLGLPAGLGLLIVSPRAIAKAKQINDRKYYNSFLFMLENIQKFQTHHTPNVLGIYLLMRVLEQVESIQTEAKILCQRAEIYYNFFEKHAFFKPLVKNKAVRSATVMCVEGSESHIATVKTEAEKAGIILGNGYGIWKNTTFRIANFPQISENEIEKLLYFFQTFNL